MKILNERDLKKLKLGDIVLVDAISKEVPMAYSGKYKSLVYPILDEKGRALRNQSTKSGKLISIYADKNGDSADKKEFIFDFIGKHSSFSIKEHKAKETLEGFNVKKLDKKDPRYKSAEIKELRKSAIAVGLVMSVAKLFFRD